MNNRISKERKVISTPEEKAKRKKTLTKVCIILCLVMIALAAVYSIMKPVSESLTESGNYIEQIQETYPTYTPFPAKWNVNLSEDTEYLSLNTNIMYGEGESGSLYSLEDFFAQNMHEGQKFFLEYFRILRQGDYEKYPSLFSDKYKKIPVEKRFEKNVERQFPPQRVHDILIREIGRFEDKEKNVIYGVYFVDYKIDRNNNLFRNDIGRNSDLGIDTSRPLYFELVTKNPHTDSEETHIANMYTESSMKAHANKSAAEE